MLEPSILKNIRKMMQMPEDYTDFDMELTIHINSAFSTLHQLGVGPETAFSIQDEGAVWTDFTENTKTIESVKTYVYIAVRILFDPPTNSAVLTAFQDQKKELEFRLNVAGDPAPALPLTPTINP